jgi:hypothetical protein
MGNTENHIQRELSRSYSFELPMEFKQSTLDNLTPRVRHSLNQHENKRRLYAHKTNRLSLNHAPINDSQVALRNRQVGKDCFSKARCI